MRLLLVALIVPWAPVLAASFTPLGDLPGGDFSSTGYDVSSDGRVVVGQGSSASGSQAFVWDLATGMVGIGSESIASGISAAGDVVVGTTTTLGGPSAFRWTSVGGLELIPGAYLGSGISADGSTVVGTRRTAAGSDEAFRWTTESGIEGLGVLSAAVSPWSGAPSYSYGLAVSGNGSVVVGDSRSSVATEAFRWTAADGMVGLGYLPGGTSPSGAVGVSDDGAVVVGDSRNSSGFIEAFRWSVESGMVGLGDLPGGEVSSEAFDVSADGNVIVGRSVTENGHEAFVWTTSGGMQRLFDVLVSNGATGLDGWTLVFALGLSADGQWVVGKATNPLGQSEAFLANLAPVPLPAVAWLFAGAIAALGLARRKVTQ
jgi:probable HAF family extracellular repeat protein